MKCDIVIVGTGVAGLYAALNLPKEKKVIPFLLRAEFAFSVTTEITILSTRIR